MNRTATRAGRAVRGLAALAGLTATVFGVPLGLMAVGQGPPGGVPPARTLAHGFAQSVSDTTLLRAAALLCWLLWALFVLAVAIEIARLLVGVGRGHKFPRGRLGVPGLQGWARTLVLSAALLLPQRAMTSAIALPGTGAPGPAIAQAVAWTAAKAVPSTPAAVPRNSSEARRYVVKRYDSLWAIAERHLGRGTRWREIRDEAGHRLGGDGASARIIYPGEVVLLPHDGTSLARPGGPVPSRVPHHWPTGSTRARRATSAPDHSPAAAPIASPPPPAAPGRAGGAAPAASASQSPVAAPLPAPSV
ncbi:MAG: LysM peptidoglycan-binding domain-containing protein, partial [Actinomycetota bacterium]|nr:LysM peptidoglycan-binding domain-containing protein [Actinomycetota bacterium]